MTDVIDITDNNFEAEVLGSREPVLVDYWAPWCAPCRMLAPVVEQLAREHPDTLRVARVNVDEHPRLADSAGIRGIPHLVLYNAGKVSTELSGAHSKAGIERAFRLDRGVEDPRGVSAHPHPLETPRG
jgi:thioredoxin 1